MVPILFIFNSEKRKRQQRFEEAYNRMKMRQSGELKDGEQPSSSRHDANLESSETKDTRAGEKPEYVLPKASYSESISQRFKRQKDARPEYVPPQIAYWDYVDQQTDKSKQAEELEQEPPLEVTGAQKIVESMEIAPSAPETASDDTLLTWEEELEAEAYEAEGFFGKLKQWAITRLRKRIQQVVAIVVFVIVCVYFTGYIGRVYSAANDMNHVNLWNQQRFEDFYALPEGWLDMVFLGSSHSFTTFDPAQFSDYFNAFQMGMPLQTPDSSFFTLLEVFNYQSPDIIVMDLYWNVMINDFEIRQLDPFFRVLRNDELRQRYIRELPFNERVMYEIQAIRYQEAAFAFANSQILNFTRESEFFYEEGFEEDLPVGIEYYRLWGYVYSNIVMTATEYERISRTPARRIDFTIAPRQRHFLEEMIRLAEQHGSQLVFVTAPISNVAFANILNYYEIHRELSDFAELHGIPYLDFHMRNIELGLFDDDMFRDHGHLNHRGAEIAGEYFLRWLQGVLR